MKYYDVVKSTKTEEEQKQIMADRADAENQEGDQPKPYVPPAHLFDYDRASGADKTQLLNRFELIKRKKIEFSPSAG